MQVKKLGCPYLKDVWLAWDFTPAEVNKWFNRQKLTIDPWGESNAGRFITYRRGGYMVNLLLLPKRVKAATMSHEILHLAWEVLHRQSGVGFSDESEEAFAYYVSFMYSQCEAVMKRGRVKK